MDSILDLSSLDRVFLYLSAFLGAFIVALWLGFIFWTHRDIRSRSQDRSIQILSTLIVALLTLPGLLRSCRSIRLAGLRLLPHSN
jgi:hypothetical protein